jgi:hypothetical protein
MTDIKYKNSEKKPVIHLYLSKKNLSKIAKQIHNESVISQKDLDVLRKDLVSRKEFVDIFKSITQKFSQTDVCENKNIHSHRRKHHHHKIHKIHHKKHSHHIKPVEEKPVEEKPVEEKPVEEKLVEEPKPVEEKLVEEPKPVEEKPVEEPKPVEEKPVEEPKPVEEKPVEESKPDEEVKYLNNINFDINDVDIIECDNQIQKVNILQNILENELLNDVIEEKPVEEKLVEEKPVEEKPVEEKPVEEKLVEEKLVEEKLVEEKLVEEKLVEEKLVEEKLVEEKLVEEKLVEEKLVEEKPIDDITMLELHADDIEKIQEKIINNIKEHDKNLCEHSDVPIYDPDSVSHMSDQIDRMILDTSNLITPEANLQSHVLFNTIVKKAKKWGDVKTEELIVASNDEYVVLQKYRELLAANNAKIKKIVTSKFERELRRANETPEQVQRVIIPLPNPLPIVSKNKKVKSVKKEKEIVNKLHVHKKRFFK